MPTLSTTAPQTAAFPSSTRTRRDLAQHVTDQIVSLIESGVRPWERSWSTVASPMPLRHNGEPYRGINVLLLWASTMQKGYTSPYWMTFRQALELGAHVRKGEKGSLVVFYGSAQSKESGETAEGEQENSAYRFLKEFTVFNSQQIEGLPPRYSVQSCPVVAVGQRRDEIEALVQRTGATIHHGGNRAFYRAGTDSVHMPNFEQFPDPECYYATLFHELAHWTKAPTRLNRDFASQRWGDDGYAIEELVAELSAAFLGAELGFAPKHLEDHAAYLACWLKALKNDKRLIFTAAAKAQSAADFIMGAG